MERPASNGDDGGSHARPSSSLQQPQQPQQQQRANMLPTQPAAPLDSLHLSALQVSEAGSNQTHVSILSTAVSFPSTVAPSSPDQAAQPVLPADGDHCKKQHLLHHQCPIVQPPPVLVAVKDTIQPKQLEAVNATLSAPSSDSRGQQHQDEKQQQHQPPPSQQQKQPIRISFNDSAPSSQKHHHNHQPTTTLPELSTLLGSVNDYMFPVSASRLKTTSSLVRKQQQQQQATDRPLPAFASAPTTPKTPLQQPQQQQPLPKYFVLKNLVSGNFGQTCIVTPAAQYKAHADFRHARLASSSGSSGSDDQRATGSQLVSATGTNTSQDTVVSPPSAEPAQTAAAPPLPAFALPPTSPSSNPVTATASEGSSNTIANVNNNSSQATTAPIAVAPAKPKQLLAKLVDLHNISKESQHAVESEIQCLSLCRNHPNVVRLLESHVCRNSKSDEAPLTLVMILEFCDGGDLRAQHQYGVSFSEDDAGVLFFQLLLALHHLHHKHRIIHRDIKTANIMVTTDGLLKLGDFGFARQYPSADDIRAPVERHCAGTPYYMAPELISGQPHGKQVDIWAAGVVLYELLSSGELPFQGSDFRSLKEHILAGDMIPLPTGATRAHVDPMEGSASSASRRGGSQPLPPPRPHRNVSREMENFCYSMLQPDPMQRPDTATLLDTPLMRKAADRYAATVIRNTKLLDGSAREQAAWVVQETLASLSPSSRQQHRKHPADALCHSGSGSSSFAASGYFHGSQSGTATVSSSVNTGGPPPPPLREVRSGSGAGGGPSSPLLPAVDAPPEVTVLRTVWAPKSPKGQQQQQHQPLPPTVTEPGQRNAQPTPEPSPSSASANRRPTTNTVVSSVVYIYSSQKEWKRRVISLFPSGTVTLALPPDRLAAQGTKRQQEFSQFTIEAIAVESPAASSPTSCDPLFLGDDQQATALSSTSEGEPLPLSVFALKRTGQLSDIRMGFTSASARREWLRLLSGLAL